MSHAHIQTTASDLRTLRLPWSALIANKAKELWTKATGRRIKGQGMIGADHSIVREGFGSLIGKDFHEYNLPQAWVERRQIPQVLHRRVPVENARVVDLGCGPGTSTEVLCHFASPTWKIVGFDLTAHLIDVAKERAARGEFKNREGVVITPEFRCQSIAERLEIADSSIDLAISGGVVGLYLSVEQARTLVEELKRIVKPGGFIALDAGPAVPVETLRGLAEGAGFVNDGKAKSFVIEPRPKLIFRKPA
jgi:SAM-dependent methyltransferase